MENGQIHAAAVPLDESVQRCRLSYCHCWRRLGACHKQGEACKNEVTPLEGPRLARTQIRGLFYELSTNNVIFRQSLTFFRDLSIRLVRKSAGRYNFGTRFAGADITSLFQTAYAPPTFDFGWVGEAAVKDYINFGRYLWHHRKKAIRGGD